MQRIERIRTALRILVASVRAGFADAGWWLTYRWLHLRSTFHLRGSEAGQGLVEYGLIIVLVAVVVIAILTILGTQIGEVFSEITGELPD